MFYWLLRRLKVVHGAELAEGSAGSEVREMEIALDHLQGSMTEDDLKIIDVPAVLKVACGEGVAQEMGMDPRDPAFALELCGEIFEGVNRNGFAIDLTDEMRGIGSAINILLVVSRAKLSEGNIPLFITFAVDNRITFIEVYPFRLQRADLSEAQPAVKHQQANAEVAEVVKLGDVEAINQLMDLGGGENVNDLALGAGELEFCGDVCGEIFVLIEPMEEGTESSDIGLNRDLGKVTFLQGEQIPFTRYQRDVFHLFPSARRTIFSRRSIRRGRRFSITPGPNPRKRRERMRSGSPGSLPRPGNGALSGATPHAG